MVRISFPCEVNPPPRVDNQLQHVHCLLGVISDLATCVAGNHTFQHLLPSVVQWNLHVKDGDLDRGCSGMLEARKMAAQRSKGGKVRKNICIKCGKKEQPGDMLVQMKTFTPLSNED